MSQETAMRKLRGTPVVRSKEPMPAENRMEMIEIVQTNVDKVRGSAGARARGARTLVKDSCFVFVLIDCLVCPHSLCVCDDGHAKTFDSPLFPFSCLSLHLVSLGIPFAMFLGVPLSLVPCLCSLSLS